MNTVCRDIFKAIHEGKWLEIEYRNQAGSETKYWIGIQSIDVGRRMLKVDGMHMGKFSIEQYVIYIDSILSSTIVDGTYCPVNQKLVDDIAINPDKYRTLFDNVANLKILNYLEMCNKLDATPYYSDYALIPFLDDDKLMQRKGIGISSEKEKRDVNPYYLTEEQFKAIVKDFTQKTDKKKRNINGNLKIQKLAMNVLSINTKKGLYVLAYRLLNLDVKRRMLIPEQDISVCTEFQIDGGTKEGIRRYLDAEDFDLLSDFNANEEKIKNAIIKSNSNVVVDDMPYIIGIGFDIILDLHSEYKAICDMYECDKVTYPIKAFFGDLLDKPRRIKSYPIALVNNNINLDQLLAINKAMMYPTAYIQGPPGTGKTNTIINTIVTAFFNERTVLFASNNNHPIDGVFEKMKSMEYDGRIIPFPILRLGNYEKTLEAMEYVKSLIKQVEEIKVFEGTLDKKKEDRKERAKQLSNMLKVYEEYLDLEERKEALEKLIENASEGITSASMFAFNMDLQMRQLDQINQKMDSISKITEKDALDVLDRNEQEFLQYLYYVSASYIKKLNEDKYKDFICILDESDADKKYKAFSDYIGKSENFRKLQKVFPVIVTTSISAHKIGKPEPIFDMTIIDEASQCNTAISLVPIIRGENLMLVGDPQQLNPVILLGDIANERLKKQYRVTDEYDYIKNSIYKTYLMCDSVSDEILLHNHYRCDPKIIGFNNKKYYNSQLNVQTTESEFPPLLFVDVPNNNSMPDMKNTSYSEAKQIVKFIEANKDKNIGIITPFVNQKDLINKELEKSQISNVTCGTVHSFQGDEKDIILFSSAIGSDTKNGTYDWIKSNRELINVATSRAKKQLIVLADNNNIERLHQLDGEDDLYELIQYVRTNGNTVVTPKETNSRALGIKPYSSKTETAFLQNLSHALENIWYTQNKCVVHKEVAISQVFDNNHSFDHLFYTGRFDFVVYENQGGMEIPVLAIELDGKEHLEEAAVRERDHRKNEICRAHNLQLIRVENTYARRYNYIKSILTSYFEAKR